MSMTTTKEVSDASTVVRKGLEQFARMDDDLRRVRDELEMARAQHAEEMASERTRHNDEMRAERETAHRRIVELEKAEKFDKVEINSLEARLANADSQVRSAMALVDEYRTETTALRLLFGQLRVLLETFGVPPAARGEHAQPREDSIDEVSAEGSE